MSNKIFDDVVLQQADDDLSVRMELLKMLLQQIDDDLAKMQSYLALSDYTKWRKQAHKLAGSCANLGAVQLANICHIAEKSSDIDAIMLHNQIIEASSNLKQHLLQKINELS
jgi:HPt (histidine-containing phosphotransfer) domain-containing protein